MVRYSVIAGCWAAMCLGRIVTAMEPVSPSDDAVRTFAEQRSRARLMIQQRAAREARDRLARIEARKRAGISLQRPVRSMPWYE